jgi:hypothetical protein
MHCSAADSLSASSSHMLLFIYCELFAVCLDTSCSSGLSVVQNVCISCTGPTKVTRFCTFFLFLATFGICDFCAGYLILYITVLQCVDSRVCILISIVFW